MPLFAEGITIDLGYVLAMFSGSGGVIAFLFFKLISSKDSTIADLKAENADLKSKQKSFESIAEEGLKSARDVANWYRKKYEDKPPIVAPAAVISEANSPSTEKQRTEARIATMRAGMAQIKLETGQEPRPEPEHAIEPPPPK